VVSYSIGENEEAIANYDRAIELDPDFPGPYNMRGSAHLFTGNCSLARADLEHYLELVPSEPNANTIRDTLAEQCTQ